MFYIYEFPVSKTYNKVKNIINMCKYSFAASTLVTSFNLYKDSVLYCA